MLEPTRLPRSRLRARYLRIRGKTEELCGPLEPEDFVIQSMDDASPPKWHLAHTTWFFETFVLDRFRPRRRPFDESYRVLFNSYYETVGDQHPRPRRGILARPSIDRIRAYRAAIDRELLDLCEEAPQDTWADLFFLVTLGLNHEQQHQELLLMDIKHNFSCNPLRPAYDPALVRRAPGPAGEATLRFVEHPGGEVEIGAAGGGFAYDNETPRHRVLLGGFSLGDRLVTNGEWIEFIDAGGYARSELWLSDGFAAARRQKLEAPLYWERDERGWQVFTLGGMRRVDDREPVVHVSYYEADAFARWRGARLPTEAEWEVFAAPATVEGNLAETGALHPRPASKRDGVRQLYGDVWELTASPYVAYPGFRPLAGSLGEYNGKFMCNQMVLRGGSALTPRSHIRESYRNFFYPHQRWCFQGLRLAR